VKLVWFRVESISREDLSVSVLSAIELVVPSVWIAGYSKNVLGGNAHWCLSCSGVLRLVN